VGAGLVGIAFIVALTVFQPVAAPAMAPTANEDETAEAEPAYAP
jgi:hypothetical protein